MKYNPRNELKDMMTNLVGIKERIRDIQFEISMSGNYNDTSFTNYQLDEIRKGLGILIDKIFEIEGIRVKAFKEYKIKEEE